MDEPDVHEHGMIARMQTQKTHTKGAILRLFGVGVCMGSADVVPGVSGGTIALICGIYERLLQSITLVTGDALKTLVQGRVRDAYTLIPFSFLVPLGVGILVAVFTLAHLLSWLLTAYPVYLWSFFFGLILASTYVVLTRTTLRTFGGAAGFLLGIVSGYAVVGLLPMQTPQTWWMLFLSGAIAISAMILPGISGSFMLLILGQYQHILTAVTQARADVLLVFAAGCAVGLALFSRLLSWLLARYQQVTLAVLAGLMLGSLRKIWPWKEVQSAIVAGSETEPLIIETNVLPAHFDTAVLLASVLCILGIAIVLSIHILQTTRANATP